MQRILLFPALLFSTMLSAQTACDSLHIVSVKYAPFGDGLHISLHNGSMQVLSGPTLDVLDADGTTLVDGVMEFFSLIPGSTTLHQAHFTPQPPTPFSGTVVLHYADWDGSVTCSFPIVSADLCPPEGCVPLEVFAYQQGGNPVAMDLDWSVTDADNSEMESGALHMDGTGFGFVVSELCLLPGAYTLHVAQPIAAGNLIQVGMTQASFAYTDGVLVQLPVGGAVDLPFDYYIHCMDGTQGIATPILNVPTIAIDGRILRVSSNNGSALGTLILLDATGRFARSITTNASAAFSDLSGLASGVYMVRPLDSTNGWSAQRFILR